MTTSDRPRSFQPDFIVSGGQTGVDRAALDVALELGIPCGGWCPRGRQAEDGIIDSRYPLKETESPDYAMRTQRNVNDSDATLVLTLGPPDGGTAITIAQAERRRTPCLVLDLGSGERGDAVAAWLARHRPSRLNVAGPRESEAPGIYTATRSLLRILWSRDVSVTESGE